MIRLDESNIDEQDDQAELVSRVVEGDLQAQTQLYESLQNYVYGVCVHLLGNHHDAEDVAQEVLDIVLRKMHSFRGESSHKKGTRVQLRTWVYRIAYNCCATKMRRKKCSEVEYDFSEDFGSVTAGEDSNKLCQREDICLRVRQAISLLPSQNQQILGMRYREGKSVEAIAEVLAIPEATVKTRLHRTHKRIQRLLASMADDYGFTPRDRIKRMVNA